jgi:hypothetical protein
VSGGTGFEITIVSFAVTVNGIALESTSFTVNVNVPAAVGMPETAPVAAFQVSPGGNDPPDIVVVSDAVPPAETIVVLYGDPTIPAGGAPASVGSGLTVIVTVSSLLVSGIAAVSITCIGDVIPAGAVNVVLAPVEAETVPHPVPLHAMPESVHVTP